MIVCAVHKGILPMRLSTRHAGTGIVFHAHSACKKEMTMLASLDLEPIALMARTVHRVEHARGMQVTCVKGVTWITQERDGRDLILAAGHSVVLDRPGLAVVYAFRDALITVGPSLALPPPEQGRKAARSHADRAWA
jgi:hypothetical protein